MDWQSTLRGDVNEQWDIFLGILKGLESQSVAQRNLNKRRHKVPWITGGRSSTSVNGDIAIQWEWPNFDHS